MTEKPEQSQDHSKAPSLEEMSAMSLEKQEQLIRELEAQEHGDENSETSEETSSEEQPEVEDSKEEHAQEDATSQEVKSESESTDTQKKETQVNWEKRYKDLQAEFTRQRQKEAQKAKPETTDEKPRTDSKKPSVVDKIREKNPEAAELFKALKEEALEEAKEQIQGEIETLKSKITVNEAKENMARFQESVDSFLGSPLKELEPELMAEINNRFESDEALLRAASQNPKLFDEIKKEVIAANLERAAEIISKSKAPKVSESKREAEILSAKGAGKAKTSKVSSDPYDLKNFEKLSLEEQEKLLRAKGEL